MRTVPASVQSRAAERIALATSPWILAGYYLETLQDVGYEAHTTPEGWVFGSGERALFVPQQDRTLAVFSAWYFLRENV